MVIAPELRHFRKRSNPAGPAHPFAVFCALSRAKSSRSNPHREQPSLHLIELPVLGNAADMIKCGMIFKGLADHVVKQSSTCGEIREILRGGEYSPNLALAIGIGPTTAHYHETFDEIYFVLDGSLVLKLYDPVRDELTTRRVDANELCVIIKGVHHQVIEATPENRLCVITVPRFDMADEHLSEKI